jgi:hypothetical protein
VLFTPVLPDLDDSESDSDNDGDGFNDQENGFDCHIGPSFEKVRTVCLFAHKQTAHGNRVSRAAV